MPDVPESHPRKDSLSARQKIVDGAKRGLLADSAMIAHGRGEAFDYLLGEKTTESATMAIRRVATLLTSAERPVISTNGNTAVLAGESMIRVAAVVGCPIEVNLYYHTPERVSGLLSLLGEQRDSVAKEKGPSQFKGDWSEAVRSVRILGDEADFRIEGLEGPRSLCTEDGIGLADLILVPLEDGDRCEALISLGKLVCVIDLNPLSRTARMASVTIVDEVSRAAISLLSEVLNPTELEGEWDNDAALRDSLKHISNAIDRL